MTSASDAALAAGASLPECRETLDLVAGYLSTELGRAELERLRFYRDRDTLESLQRRNAQAAEWLSLRGGFAFSALEADPRPSLREARLPGTALAVDELLRLGRFLDACAALRDRILGDEAGSFGRPEAGGDRFSGHWPELARLAEALPELGELRRRLQTALLPTGEVADGASPELAAIRRRRVRQRQAIEASLAQHLRRLGGEGVLQEELITLRNERFVLPVRTELRRRAPGVVHGASSSGQTVFVEPLETIELNNDHIRLIEQEQVEIHRILVALTAAVGAEHETIAAAAEICGVLELEAAKARFARDYKANPVEFGEALELRQARHPVLVAALRASSGGPGREVVPLSLRLDAERVLVISGPNTGGKTVVLKTVGIAAWMAQCGLPVCAEHARLPIFDQVWADIGDVQSLEHSLSTFSAHLVHIRSILLAAGAHSLVLLDELGTATNAAEGAALAVEIAEFLAGRRVWTLISTHHDAMKVWASSRPGVVNGSVQVDAETLAPSYQFRLGVPGLSAGLDMAQRLGLPDSIVQGARGRLTASEREAGRYLQDLQRKLAEAEARLSDLEQREREVRERERALESHDHTAQQRQLAALRTEADRRLASLQTTVEANWRRTMQDLHEDITTAQRRKLAVAHARLKRETAEAFQAQVQPAAGREAEPEPDSSVQPKPGDRVRLRSISQPARVIRERGAGVLEVEAGKLRMQVPLSDVTAVLGSGGWVAPAMPDVRPDSPAVAELNLIGLRAEEALDRLDKFIDQALLADTAHIRIVHGAGFGVLRKAVDEALRAHPQIARHYHPPQNEGGQGVTMAELR